ncbi:MAG: CapA family protein [Clostridia bacterium]|nr:CapA family protein [Clostridia bacterium]
MRKFFALLTTVLLAGACWAAWCACSASESGEILITVSAAGDVTHGGDRRKGTDLFARELARQDGDYAFAFRNVRDLFEASDLTIVNYEGTLTGSPPATDNSFSFAGAPENVQSLVLGGINAVALDNNHVFDHGRRGYADTQDALREAGILFSGNGQSALCEIRGVRIGMLSYNTLRSGYSDIHKRMPGDIRELRGQGCALVIVSYHWGYEREYAPHQRQIELGRATIDAGADLVLGHHGHVINPIERYNGRYIVYSLANFSFAGNSNPSDKDTFIFQQRFRVTRGGVEDAGMRIVPCRVSSVPERNDLIPTPYGPGDAERIANKLVALGRGLEFALTEYPLEW